MIHVLPAPASSRVNRSHRYCTVFRVCGDPVGAGLPAKRPVQAYYLPNHRTFSNFRALCLARPH
ncbi:hypothetical protein D0O09_11345 [Pseudomonas putida]|nr:hypothetical protein D0O09_11345 [Pseudomonas putida]